MNKISKSFCLPHARQLFYNFSSTRPPRISLFFFDAAKSNEWNFEQIEGNELLVTYDELWMHLGILSSCLSNSTPRRVRKLISEQKPRKWNWLNVKEWVRVCVFIILYVLPASQFTLNNILLHRCNNVAVECTSSGMRLYFLRQQPQPSIYRFPPPPLVSFKSKIIKLFHVLHELVFDSF